MLATLLQFLGGPIVQTPRQALATLRRAGGIDVLFLRAADGVTYAAWHAVDAGAKDSGRRFRAWAEAWEAERCA